MNQIHCHFCGGSISDPATVSYRVASAAIIQAQPHAAPCNCTPAIVYGPPAGYMSWPGLPSLPKETAQ
jgi:creatinine amidohydrolase/Fe(II)-dependent formamide hydrolase-like protein